MAQEEGGQGGTMQVQRISSGIKGKSMMTWNGNGTENGEG